MGSSWSQLPPTIFFLGEKDKSMYVHISVHKYVVVVLLGVSGGAKY